jgi:ABC-type dipeptide/oligopeptide/nickel transport system ATPase component
MKIKQQTKSRESRTEIRAALSGILDPAETKGRACGPSCQDVCSTCAKTDCQCMCTPSCQMIPLALTSDPGYPIESLIAPLVFELNRAALYDDQGRYADAEPLHVLGIGKTDAVARAEELLTLVGLSDKMANYPNQLSGGQQQRVAIARALAMRTKVLLFDEVTSALDPETVGEVLNVIRTLARQGNYTMLIVTHQMSFAREVSDRVCFFYGGCILEQGPPDQIFLNPIHARTQMFLSAILESH